MYTIAVILVILWLLGLLFSIGGAFIHLLLLIAVVLFLVGLFGKKKGGGGGMPPPAQPMS